MNDFIQWAWYGEGHDALVLMLLLGFMVVVFTIVPTFDSLFRGKFWNR